VSRELPSFDLVVATVGRGAELDRLLDSLAAQTYSRSRLLVVDQNEDERVERALEARSGLDVVHLRSGPGLSRARNAALPLLHGDLVGFPDDDCVYPPDLLERVAALFAAHPALDGLTGRAADDKGRSSASWKTDEALLTRDNLWNRAISYTIFVRHGVVTRVGEFDERLGLGSPEPWSSGEETDYLIRALDTGARIQYDPSLVVEHELRENDAAIGFRDGSSIGYLLRKHGYPARVLGRMLARPAGGALLSIARLDPGTARYQAATLRGRLTGYRGASPSKS
jgi:glycosyltransferase involved in cell wall biosynthesis